MSNRPVPPSSLFIDPVLYPPIKNQQQPPTYYNTCVAEAITTVMELFHSRAKGLRGNPGYSYEYYSIRYLFGSDNGSYGEYGMWFTDALDVAQNKGVPRWELIDKYYPQRGDKADSINAYTEAINIQTDVNNSKNQKITWSSIDFYNRDEQNKIENCLNNGGYVLFGFTMPATFDGYYIIQNDGVLLQPSAVDPDPRLYPPPSGSRYGTVGHMMVIIGLTVKNGKKHWIAVNSWGEQWGDLTPLNEKPGICYIPYDWGFDDNPAYQKIDPETGSIVDTVDWVTGCYEVYPSNIISSHPNPPTITGTRFVSDDSTGKRRVEISFTKPSGCSVLIYARKKNDWVEGDGTPYIPPTNRTIDEVVGEDGSVCYGYVKNSSGVHVHTVYARWWPKGESGATSHGDAYSTSPVIITLDGSTDPYQISLLSIDTNNILSVRSAIIDINGSNIFIYNGSKWVPATPYIYHNGRWVQAQAKIFQN